MWGRSLDGYTITEITLENDEVKFKQTKRYYQIVIKKTHISDDEHARIVKDVLNVLRRYNFIDHFEAEALLQECLRTRNCKVSKQKIDNRAAELNFIDAVERIINDGGD